MLGFELIMRWTHILAAIALAGGTIFRRFALLPAAAELPDEARQQLAASLRGRWSKVVMITSALLLVSGFVNFMLTITRFEVPKSYHMMFGIKFLLALVVFVLAALLTGRTALADRLRQNEKFWLNLNLLLAIVLVCLGGVLKVAERHPKSVSSTSSPAVFVSVP